MPQVHKHKQRYLQYVSSMNSYYFSTERSQLNDDLICDFLSNQSYWAKGRSRQVITKSIENSLCFGVFDATDNQLAFARVISDYAVFAWLLDLFILEEHRGKGLGKMLLTEIMARKELKGIKRWGLGTRDAHSLYEKYGFKPLSKPETMMERTL